MTTDGTVHIKITSEESSAWTFNSLMKRIFEKIDGERHRQLDAGISPERIECMHGMFLEKESPGDIDIHIEFNLNSVEKQKWIDRQTKGMKKTNLGWVSEGRFVAHGWLNAVWEQEQKHLSDKEK